MERHLSYVPLQPRQIRVLQIWLDEKDRKELEEAFALFLLHAQEHVKYSPPRESTEDEENAPAGSKTGEPANKRYKIQARFSVQDLDSSLQSYNAISYCWGTSEKPQKIWFDDNQYLAITESAMEVLVYLITEKDTAWIWLDAICINQEDISEKSQQVQMMYDIYFRADEVIAWTGKHFDNFFLIPSFMNDLNKQFEMAADEGVKLTKRSLISLTGLEFPSAKWNALAQFLARPFFSRIWIVQEMVAARTIRLLCGRMCVQPWALFRCVAHIISIGESDLLQDPTDMRFGAKNRGIENVSTIMELRGCVHVLEQPPTLPYALARCQAFSCTDGRDKLYAMLNISSCTSDVSLAPNYKKPIESVFTDAISYLLTKPEPLLSLLYGAGIGEDRTLESLPSWVPDWTVKPRTMSFGIGVECSRLVGEQLYSATGKNFLPNVTRRCGTSAPLHIMGRILFKVVSVKPALPAIRDVKTGPFVRFENSELITRWILDLSQILPPGSTYPTKELFFPNALASTLIAGEVHDVGLSPDSVAEYFVDYFALQLVSSRKSVRELYGQAPSAIQWRMRMITDLLEAVPSSSKDGHTEATRLIYDKATTYHIDMRRNRRLFSTEQALIGLGPLLMQEDDVVCLLYGCDVPFLIRPRDDDTYHLVGECYVHGLMHGQGAYMGEEKDIILY